MADEFNVHRLNKTGLEKADKIATIFEVALAEIDALVSTGRERSLVITKMQEACFFAKRSIAIDPANQE